MVATVKPNLTRVWASGAPGSNVVDPDTTTPGKFDAGWLAEVPPFEHFNFLQKLFTQGLAHNNEQGINAHDVNTVYPIGGIAKGSDNIVYQAIIEQSSNDPVGDIVNWKIWNNSINDLSQAYTFKTVALMQSSLIVFPVGKKIFWQGYYVESDGGSNWGLVKAGAGTDDGGKIFTLADGQHVEANLKGKINIRKYGAKGNGASGNDDGAVIEKVLIAHEEVYAPSGTFAWKNPIYLTVSNRSLDGKHATMVYHDDYNHTASGTPLEQLQFINLGKVPERPYLTDPSLPVSNVQINGVTFDGTQPASILDGDTIYKSVMIEIAAGSSDIELNKVKFISPRGFSPSRGSAFARDGSSDVRMIKCRATNPNETIGEGGGGFVISGDNCRVRSCYVENMRDSSIGFDGATNSKAIGNTLVFNTVDGSGFLIQVGNLMQLTDGARGNTILRNNFTGYSVGLEVSQIGGTPFDVHHNLIAHNIFNGGGKPSSGAASYAIRLGDIARDNTISHNIIYNPSNKGDGSTCIQLFPRNNTVTHNQCSDLDDDGNRETGSLVDGIHIRFDDDPKTNITVTHNPISVGRRQIHLTAGDYLDTKHMIIENNPLNANTTDGLNTSLVGIEISNTGTKFLRINNNDFIGAFSSDWSGTWDYIAYFQAPNFSHKKPKTSVGYENKILYRTVIPTSKSWVAGDEVHNITKVVDGNNMVLDHWLRITTGSGNVLNTDWVAQYESTVSPAT